MAMFSGQTTTVTTPDGRTLVIPAEVAASLRGLPPPQGPGGPQLVGGSPALGVPSLTPQPPPGVPGGLPTGGAPEWGPQDAAELAAQTAQVPPPDATAAPVTLPSQIPSGGPRAQPRRGPTTEPGPDQGIQPVTPTPPPTNEQLAALGAGGSLQLENKALDEQAAATRAAAGVEGETSDKQADVLKQRDIDTAAAAQERMRAAAEERAKLEQRMRDRDAYAAKLANERIDRSVDHPVWTAIGLALSTIGTAMQNQQAQLSAALLGHAAPAPIQNPALAAMFGAIDRKVDTQMKELDLRKAGLAQMNLAIGDQRQIGIDRLAEIDARRDAALQQAKQSVETIAAQMKNPQAKANAALIIGKIDEERAKAATAAVDRAQTQLNVEAARKQAAQQHAQSIAVQRRGQDLQYQIHREDREAQEREKMAQISADLLKGGKDVDAKKAKDLEERGVWDPRTGDMMLDPKGRQKLAEADRLEAVARQQRDPAVADQQRVAAQQLRLDAKLNNGVIAPSKETAEKLRPHLQVAQNATDEVGLAIQELGTDPSAFDRAKWAGIATRLGNIAFQYQKTVGERPSVRAFEQTMKHILEFDPDSYFDRAASQNRALESLKTLKGIIVSDADSELKSNGIKSEWVPKAKGDDAVTFSPNARTAAEAEEAAKPNTRAQITSLGLVNLFDSGGDARREVEGQKGAAAGLPATTVAALHGMALRAERAGDTEHAQIVEAIKGPIEAGLGDTKGGRPSLAWGMLNVLREDSPKLYGEVLARLPKDQVEQIRAIDKGRIDVPTLPKQPKGTKPYDPDASAKSYRDEQNTAAAKARADAQKAYETISERARRRNEIERGSP